MDDTKRPWLVMQTSAPQAMDAFSLQVHACKSASFMTPGLDRSQHGTHVEMQAPWASWLHAIRTSGGCMACGNAAASTLERPTRRYIEAHESLYKAPTDAKPLKGVQRGGGICNPKTVGVVPDACGGNERGRCTLGKVCECRTGWTGPHCLAPQGRDPILYDQPDSIMDVGFIPPGVFPKFLAFGGLFLIVLLVFTVRCRRTLEGWSPIPSVEAQPLDKYTAQDAYSAQQEVYWT